MHDILITYDIPNPSTPDEPDEYVSLGEKLRLISSQSKTSALNQAKSRITKFMMDAASNSRDSAVILLTRDEIQISEAIINWLSSEEISYDMSSSYQGTSITVKF